MIRLATRGRFTQDYVKGMMAAPEDREPALRKLIEAVGGKVISFYVTTGETDFLLISETNESEAIIASLMAAASTGTISHISTSRAWTGAEIQNDHGKGFQSGKRVPASRQTLIAPNRSAAATELIGTVDPSPSPQLPVAFARPGWEALSSSLKPAGASAPWQQSTG